MTPTLYKHMYTALCRLGRKCLCVFERLSVYSRVTYATDDCTKTSTLPAAESEFTIAIYHLAAPLVCMT